MEYVLHPLHAQVRTRLAVTVADETVWARNGASSEAQMHERGLLGTVLRYRGN